MSSEPPGWLFPSSTITRLTTKCSVQNLYLPERLACGRRPEKHHYGLTRAVSLQKGSGYKQAARKTNSARDTLLFTARGSATAAVQQAARGMKK